VSGKRVLVTGAAGFIGSHLSEALLERGDRVVGLDNMDDYYDVSVKWDNISRSCAEVRYEFVLGDIRDADMLSKLFEREQFDVVVHLAARAGVRPSLLKPALYDQVNVLGTTRILDAARQYGVPHIVFGSSSSVYGGSSRPPFRETDPADRPCSPYAATKRANELACHAYHHLYDRTVTCLRFFTVYGPRQRPEMAIHQFARLIAEDRPVNLYGDGSSRRDYTYIDDIVRGIIASVDRPNGYRIYNLGTTETTPLLSLVEKISDRLGRPARINFQDNQAGDVPLTHADVSLASSELDYGPKIDIDEGLDRFVDWFARRRDRALLASVPPRRDRRRAGGIDLTDAATQLGRGILDEEVPA
jgi:UDP-glucuronate 4-epimerase